MSKFEKKIVVVLNADTEIGSSIATRFLSEGACVILNGFQYFLSSLTKDADPRRYMWHEGDATEDVYLRQSFC